MSTGKTYSTKYLLDSNNNRGSEGQILSTTSTGIDWVDANSVPGTGLWVTSGNNIYNSNSGNVGIGTTSPSEKLEVDSGIIKVVHTDNTYTKVKGTGLYFNRSNVYIAPEGDNVSALNVGLNGQRWSQLKLNADTFTVSRAAAEFMRITSTGNVGIGTTSPVAKLDVLGKINQTTSSGGNAASFTNSDATSGYGVAIQSEGTANTRYALILRNLDSSDVYGGVSTMTNQVGFWGVGASPTGTLGSRLTVGGNASIGTSYTGTAAPSNGMIVQGNVGIGVTNPQDFNSEANNLVIGTGSGVEGMTIYGGSSGGSSIHFADGTSGSALYEGFLQYRHSQRAMWFGTAAGVRMTLDGSGYLGIGTTNPQSKLQIQANQHAADPGAKNYTGSAINADGGDIATGKLFLQGYQKTANDLCGFNNEADRVVLYNYTDARYLQLWNHNGDTIIPNGNVGIGTTAPNVSGVGSESVVLSVIETAGNRRGILELGDNQNADTGGIGSINFVGHYQNTGHKIMAEIRASGSGSTSGQRGSFIGMFTKENGTAAIAERMRIASDGKVKFNAYNGTNKTGTPTYLLGTDASGNIVKTNSAPSPITSQAASLYDLIPNGAFTTTYAFTSTAGTYAEVMEGNDVITASGTYSVQMFVSDYAVGGTQYSETYSGIMSWTSATNTNSGSGDGAISEIVLHRSGHATNTGVTYLRTRETTSVNGGKLKLEIMCNRTYTGASNVVFKFVRLI